MKDWKRSCGGEIELGVMKRAYGVGLDQLLRVVATTFTY